MKKLLLIIILGMGFHPVQAQLFTKEKLRNLENFDKQQWSWGYYLGFNSYDFKFNYKHHPTADIKVKKNIGFNVGLLGNLRINDYLDLRLEPGVSFVKRKLIFPAVSPDAPTGNVRDVNSTYINIPLLLKVSTKRINNFKPFVIAGLSTSYNLSSNENSKEDNMSGKFRMKTNTYYWEVGFGIDFYLFFFKFTPSIRAIFAMSDELVPDRDPNSPYTGNIQSMKTRGIFINFKFQ